MNVGVVFALVALLGVGSFFLGRQRALQASGGDVSGLHSLPGYYGWYAALWCGLPGLLVACVWLLVGSWGIDQLTLAGTPQAALGENEAEVTLFLNDVKNLASGNIVSDVSDPALKVAAERYTGLRSNGLALAAALAALLSLAGGAMALRAVAPGFAARVRVER